MAFVTMPGNDLIRVVDAYTGQEINTIPTGSVPTDTLVDGRTNTLYALNFLSRSITAYDIDEMVNGGSSYTVKGEIKIVTNELLSPEVLNGKKLFYNASSSQLNMEGYMSCASCHLDGAHDGRTWDFSTPAGEGLRNSIDLRGRAGLGHGRLHWTGNFDEVHDFENQIRDLGRGAGLLNDDDFSAGSRSVALGDPKSGLNSDLDDLSAYVTSLTSVPRSPHRNEDGLMSDNALRGQQVFNALNCVDCHGGEEFTDSSLGLLHNVGTISSSSGNRLGDTISGFDTPTLRGIWATAPYLHDGSAPTLRDVLVTKNGEYLHGDLSLLSEDEITHLIEYLNQVDDIAPAVGDYKGVGSKAFESYSEIVDKEADTDGDGWSDVAEILMGGADITDVSDRPSFDVVNAQEVSEQVFEFSWFYKEGGIWIDSLSYQWGDIIYTPVVSTNLEEWVADSTTVKCVVEGETSPEGYRKVTAKVKSGDLERIFGKVELQFQEDDIGGE